MEKENNTTTEKVNLDEYLIVHKVEDLDAFCLYLKDVWQDLFSRMTQNKNDPKEKQQKEFIGINKVIFSSYYKLPGLIGDRLFKVFDKNNDGYLVLTEFQKGMCYLFSGNYEKSAKTIFRFYDFDKDGIIKSEDIRVVLSYIALNENSKNISYKHRVSSQEELHQILQKCFEKVSGSKMDYKTFKYVIENINSDIYLMILLFLLENKPFTNENVEQYIHKKKKAEKVVNFADDKTSSPNGKKIASPSKVTNFSPYKSFARSQNRRKTTIMMKENKIKKLLNPLDVDFKRARAKKKTVQQEIIRLKSFGEDEDVPAKKEIDENRLKNLKGKKQQKNLSPKKGDIEFLPAFKQIGGDKYNSSKKNIKEGFDINKLNFDSDEEDEDDDNNEQAVDYQLETEEVNKTEGLLYKYVEGKMRKLWFKLVHKDLYYYKNKEDKEHKGMHNLSGLFLEEGETKVSDGIKYYCFSVVYPTKTRVYYCDNEKEYKNWIEKLKIATGYTNLLDIYEVKQKLGNGKFGLVKLGINKETKQKVAIKIMNKNNMDSSDLELVRTEIEILRICQHPNIIRLYDVFENLNYIYIIMEYCSGGDLFGYLEERKFILPEPRAAVIMHKMCAAVYYIHSYGIAHRDLKPENVLMTSNDDNGDIRILDFGLSKIIGPNEKCTEPYGTLTYCAPEIIVDEPYTKGVDMWSLGVMAYLMLSGRLPFNSSDETQIARQIAFEEPDFVKNPAWKNVSQEAISFIKGLLQKNANQRMNIKQALDHEWIRKFSGMKINEIRKNSKDGDESTFKIYSSSSTSEIPK